MKIIAILLTLCLSFNVLAASGTVQELERQLDEYQFALTIEWDQKDQKFYEAQTSKFFEGISVLMKEQGLKEAEVLALAEKKMTDKSALAALRTKIALAGEVKSSEQLAQILKESTTELYSRGASWNGRNTETVLIALAVVAIIGYAVWFGANYHCVAWTEEWKCSSSTSYDSYGNSYTNSSCGWEDVCVAYEHN